MTIMFMKMMLTIKTMNTTNTEQVMRKRRERMQYYCKRSGYFAIL